MSDHSITSLIEGQWAVFNDAAWDCDPRYEMRMILKVTDKTVSTTSSYGARRHSKSEIGWAGSEADAKRLVERLNSSVGLMKDEVRRSKERMTARNADLIAKADRT